MSERIKLSFKGKVKREIAWLREDIVEMRDKIPEKYQDMAGFFVIFLGYFLIFDDYARERPHVAVVGAVLCSWFGVEMAILIAKALGKYPRK
ncbi:MAG TPA: hypothetical protein VE954_43225 [Oligoflexus sp.]|uniref:hypothetical protein n=1 Tax=Oligoflexus sp. TaxID=1971216 RepID=UPI002D6738BA|nr:hypothetical protein [Oligoflexus sp.]HYX39957.1 hypothetical protein [Oligoflexus sp.]